MDKKKVSLIVMIISAVAMVVALLVVMIVLKPNSSNNKPTTAPTTGTLTQAPTTEPATEEPTTEEIAIEEVLEPIDDMLGKGQYTEAVKAVYELVESGRELSNGDKENIAYFLAEAYEGLGLTYSSYRVMEEADLESDRPTEQPVIDGATNAGDRFFFGEYPQDRIEEDWLINILNALDVENDTVSYMGRRFAVLTVDDEKRFYEYMPIEWEVFHTEDGFTQMLCHNVIDQRVFHNDLIGATWDACDLRTWFNGEFMNLAFTEYERNSLKLMHFPRIYQHEIGFVTGNETDDYVGTIPGSKLLDGVIRTGVATDYAVDKGVYVSSDGFSRWWIQTSVDGNGVCTMYVTERGMTSTIGVVSNNTSVGIRPLIGILNEFLN